MRILKLLAALLALSAAAPGRADTPAFGDLPVGAVSRSEMGPASEFVLYIIFDPALARDRLPPGLRFRTLAEMATRSPEIAEHLKTHPEHAGWAHSAFEIIGSPMMSYDGVKARFGRSGGMAVWYASVARLDKTDTRPRGYQQINLGTWLSDPRLVAHMRAKGYPVEPGAISFTRSPGGEVKGRLDVAGLHVKAFCRLNGQRLSPDWAKAGTYETIWNPAGLRPGFEMVTYMGHVVEDCGEARWRMSGGAPLAQAFAQRGLGGRVIANTEFASGYVLQGGLYLP
jgi:hypothetical protein